MPQPQIAAARDPRLLPVENSPYPLREQVQLRLEDESRTWDVNLGSAIILDFSHVRLERMDIVEQQAKLTSPHPHKQMLEDLHKTKPTGVRYKRLARREPVGPASLPRAYVSVVEQGKPTVKKEQTSLELIRPTLEPSVFITDLEPPVLPWPLRDEQLEAVYSLLNSDALLLADEPGMGKTVAAIVALTSLFQQGEAVRALVVCPKSGLRHWSGHIMTWAPFLALTVVHGDQNQRALDWRTPANVYLADYNTLAIDIVGGILPEGKTAFDAVLLDGVHTIRFREREIANALECLKTPRRWALSGAIPATVEDWHSIFSFLTPDLIKGRSQETLPDMRQRLIGHILHRKKADFRDNLPRMVRQEIWLDLQERQMRVYQTAYQEEHNRFIKLGGAVTRTHIHAAVERLKRVCNFAPELLDGVKVRALVDLVEDISAAGAKVVVFSQFREDGLEELRPVLEAYGALQIDTDTPEERRDEILAAFREEPQWHVLLMEVGVRTDGIPLKEATYVVHFDHVWNPAVRSRAEQRLYPSLGSMTPINVYEFWITETIDETLYGLLTERSLLPGQVPEETHPADLEERLTIDEWLQEVFDVTPHVTPAFKIKARKKETGELPSTAMLRTHLAKLPADALMTELANLMNALGYPESKIVGQPDDRIGDLLAWREEGDAVERVFVRCIRDEKNIGVADGRSTLEAMQAQENCEIAYLVATSDFTPACKSLADESDGQLILVSGSELRRHLQIMGRY